MSTLIIYIVGDNGFALVCFVLIAQGACNALLHGSSKMFKTDCAARKGGRQLSWRLFRDERRLAGEMTITPLIEAVVIVVVIYFAVRFFMKRG